MQIYFHKVVTIFSEPGWRRSKYIHGWVQCRDQKLGMERMLGELGLGWRTTYSSWPLRCYIYS